jgi:hypothetical protein
MIVKMFGFPEMKKKWAIELIGQQIMFFDKRNLYIKMIIGVWQEA